MYAVPEALSKCDVCTSEVGMNYLKTMLNELLVFHAIGCSTTIDKYAILICKNVFTKEYLLVNPRTEPFPVNSVTVSGNDIKHGNMSKLS